MHIPCQEHTQTACADKLSRGLDAVQAFSVGFAASPNLPVAKKNVTAGLDCETTRTTAACWAAHYRQGNAQHSAGKQASPTVGRRTAVEAAAGKTDNG